MSFRFKVRQVAVCKCAEEGDKNVLVVARLTEDTFAGKNLGYRVATECGDVFDVDEKDLEKRPVEDVEETEVPAEPKPAE